MGAVYMTDTGQTPDGMAVTENTGIVADAVDDNWVDTWAPEATRPYLRLSRADRPIGTWLLLLPCWWGVLLAAVSTEFRLFDLWIIVGCALGAFLMRGAGCTWNDITDRHVDAQVARTRSRPIPSGCVSVRAALIWMAVQALISFAILLTFSPMAIALGVGSLALVCVYPFAKRFTWWPQVFLGLAFNWGALLSWAAHTGSLSLTPVILYIAGIVWTLFYDTIYAHQDTEDDALIGVKSTARLFGEHSRMWLRGFLVLSVLLLTATFLNVALQLDNPLAVALAIGACWGFGWHLAWQLGRLDTENPDICLHLFRSNRDAGLIPVAFLCLMLFL